MKFICGKCDGTGIDSHYTYRSNNDGICEACRGQGRFNIGPNGSALILLADCYQLLSECESKPHNKELLDKTLNALSQLRQSIVK